MSKWRGAHTSFTASSDKWKKSVPTLLTQLGTGGRGCLANSWGRELPCQQLGPRVALPAVVDGFSWVHGLPCQRLWMGFHGYEGCLASGCGWVFLLGFLEYEGCLASGCGWVFLLGFLGNEGCLASGCVWVFLLGFLGYEGCLASGCGWAFLLGFLAGFSWVRGLRCQLQGTCVVSVVWPIVGTRVALPTVGAEGFLANS
jgi:hypothetical protein